MTAAEAPAASLVGSRVRMMNSKKGVKSQEDWSEPPHESRGRFGLVTPPGQAQIVADDTLSRWRDGKQNANRAEKRRQVHLQAFEMRLGG